MLICWHRSWMFAHASGSMKWLSVLPWLSLKIWWRRGTSMLLPKEQVTSAIPGSPKMILVSGYEFSRLSCTAFRCPMSYLEWEWHVGSGSLESSQGFEVPKKSGIYKELQSRWPDLCHDTVVERIIRGREQYLTRNKDRAKREDQGLWGYTGVEKV